MTRKKKPQRDVVTPQGGRVGLGGVRVVSAHGDSFFNDRYMSSEPQQYVPPSMMVMPHTANTQPQVTAEPIPEDPAIQKANTKDLKDKGIK